jgi:hypothetical protein
MEEFIQLFGSLLAFVYPCFDASSFTATLSGLSRPEQGVYFVRQVLGIQGVSPELLRQRTEDYRDWVEAYARNHHLSIEWAEKGVRKEPYVSPQLPQNPTPFESEAVGIGPVAVSPTVRCGGHTSIPSSATNLRHNPEDDPVTAFSVCDSSLGGHAEQPSSL